MTEKELKRLSRSDLLELLLSLSQENDRLQRQLDRAYKQLDERLVKIVNAGSLAEASLQISGVFEATQAACDQYTQNARARILQREQQCQRLEKETKEKCERMIAEAKAQADAYRDECNRQTQQSDRFYEWLTEQLGGTIADTTQD